MTETIAHRGHARSVVLASLLLGGLFAAPAFAQGGPGAPQQPTVTDSGWAYTVEQIATGINTGYEGAIDPVNRVIYFTDAQWRTEVRDEDGTIRLDRTPSGKVVAFSTETRQPVDTYSYLGLTRIDGSGAEGDWFDWSGVTDPERKALTSMTTNFSPYGIAVDGNLEDPIIVTTTARARTEAGFGGNVVIFNASAEAPTDADRLFAFEDGTPMFDGVRRIAINTQTHKAYVTNMAEARGDEGERPGFIGVIDLQTRTLEARVRIPERFGAIGVTVDEDNNLVYVGTMSGDRLYVIDAAAIDTSNAQDIELNAALVTELEAVVGGNARPVYDAATKRVYVSSFGENGKISVVDADPASDAYGTVLGSIESGVANDLAVDAERGLLFSANLRANNEVIVYDLESLEALFSLPGAGAPLNVAVDPENGDVWVTNFGRTGFASVFSLRAPQ